MARTICPSSHGTRFLSFETRPSGQLPPRNFVGNLGFNGLPGKKTSRERQERVMSNPWKKWSLLPVMALAAGSVVLAQGQSQQTQGDPQPKSEVGKRAENQQDRIAQGIKSGQLTAGETAKLETKEAAINGEVQADRAANGGKLTAEEKAQVHRQQNRLSSQIYKDKHNAATEHYGNNRVDQRRENQQDRIAQGIKSGQLTAGETAKLENQQRAINQQTRADRAANGGKLTAGEKAQINHEQNQASRNIYNKKHNARTQAGTAPKQ